MEQLLLSTYVRLHLQRMTWQTCTARRKEALCTHDQSSWIFQPNFNSANRREDRQYREKFCNIFKCMIEKKVPLAFVKVCFLLNLLMTTDAVQKSYLSSTALSILYNLNRFIYTASELYLDANYLNARFYYLIYSQFMERMNFRKKWPF